MGNPFASLPEVTLWLGIPIVISLLSLLYTYRSDRLAHKKNLADHVEALKTQNLSLVVLTGRISGDGNYERPLHYVLDCQLRAGRCVEFPFIVEVENLGEKTASGVVLYLRYPLHLQQWASGQREATVPFTLTRDAEGEVVRLEIGNINPGDTFVTAEHLSITTDALENGSSAGTSLIGFKLEQEDVPAIVGQVSLGVIAAFGERKVGALAELSNLLPICEPIGQQSWRDILLDFFYRTIDGVKDKGQPMIFGRSVLMLTYEPNAAISDGRIDRVRPEKLLSQAGVLDRQGQLWFPSINHRRVMVFHGKLRPEVAGLRRNRVESLGERIVAKYSKRRRDSD